MLSRIREWGEPFHDVGDAIMKNLILTKPLAIIDLETTGLSIDRDRIVEISVLLIRPDGSRDSRTRRVNPGIPIPPEATAVHGISDTDVADAPTFAQLAAALLDFIAGADLAGFNIRYFDLPMLGCELERAGKVLSLEGRAIIDAMQIYKRKERRDLAAAYRFYCDKSSEDLHSAGADVQACAEILDAQLARYADLPRDPAALSALFMRGEPGLDYEGKFTWADGEAVVNFGKMKGVPLRHLAAEERGFLEWMIEKDFAPDTKEIARRALRGEFPSKPLSAS